MTTSNPFFNRLPFPVYRFFPCPLSALRFTSFLDSSSSTVYRLPSTELLVILSEAKNPKYLLYSPSLQPSLLISFGDLPFPHGRGNYIISALRCMLYALRFPLCALRFTICKTLPSTLSLIYSVSHLYNETSLPLSSILLAIFCIPTGISS